MRAVAAEGGFAAVIASGDPVAGAVVLLLRTRDGVSAYARTNLGDGSTGWRALCENEIESSVKLREIIRKQRQYDPDLWVIELDIADPARFVEDLPSTG